MDHIAYQQQIEDLRQSNNSAVGHYATQLL